MRVLVALDVTSDDLPTAQKLVRRWLDECERPAWLSGTTIDLDGEELSYLSHYHEAWQSSTEAFTALQLKHEQLLEAVRRFAQARSDMTRFNILLSLVPQSPNGGKS